MPQNRTRGGDREAIRRLDDDPERGDLRGSNHDIDWRGSPEAARWPQFASAAVADMARVRAARIQGAPTGDF